MGITHAKVSAKADGPDTSLIRPSDWNDPHVGEVIQSATVELTDAQIKALRTTPVEVVAAPGAGLVIAPILATLRLNWVADYTGIDVGASLGVSQVGTERFLLALREEVNNNVSGLLAVGAESWAILAPTSSNLNDVMSSLAGYLDLDLVDLPLSVRVGNQAANFTGGNAANTLKVTVLYAVIDV